MPDKEFKIKTPLFPPYSWVRQLMRIWEGVPKATVLAMMNAIHDQTGTPQSVLDWSTPDTWIQERLTGEVADLAHRIWMESDHTVNPRYVYGSYLFIKNFDLLIPDKNSIYRLTERGKKFLENDPQLIREIDDAEGIIDLINILATKGNAKRSDLLPEWGEFLKKYSKYGMPSTIRDTLRRRLVNLVDRGLVQRDGNIYALTKLGMEYRSQIEAPEDVLQSKLIRQIDAFNKTQRKSLHERLSKMHPYKFEHLISDLLEAMGYDEVRVTKYRGDQGIDVLGKVEVGITEITEVVQVKRRKSSVNRPIIDQLRGALIYHNAIRGTIITLGKFSSGCQEAALLRGAAPITLIDGEHLLDMLIEHQVGIRKRDVSLYEIDEESFKLENSEKIN